MGWRIVKVGGDGDCLFHALAFLDSYDGRALRFEVANFMTTHASTEPGFQQEMQDEAAKLRAGRWGGHTAIATYSRMKTKRIMVHTWRSSDNSVIVQEMSHASVHGKEDAPVAHIFYNGCDHYDALLLLTDLSGMEPAWPQPHGRNTYFKKIDIVSNRTKRGNRGKAPTQSSVKKHNLKQKPAAKQPKVANKPSGKNKSAAEARVSEKMPGEMPVPPELSQPHTESDEEAKPGLMEELEGIPVATVSEHPHRKLEDLIKDLWTEWEFCKCFA